VTLCQVNKVHLSAAVELYKEEWVRVSIHTRCYPKVRGIWIARAIRLYYVLPPLDVPSSTLCESVCQQPASWEDAFLSYVRFCNVVF
jgi:hypothetical protein